ncbi:MAG: RNA polymerase sigma factor [Acidimicrobiales bacterium]
MTDNPPIAAKAEDRLSPAIRQRFRAGDLDALGEVYDAYSGPVHTVVRGILGSGGQADDAVQEAFMRAWRGASSFDVGRPLGPWLFTIARRTSIDILRREARPTRSDHDELTDNLAGTVNIDLPGIEEAWEKWEIRVALDQLPEEERTVLMLSHFHGYTHAQIADRLGIPSGTVKSRSHRAHQRLSGLLKHLVTSESEESSDD